jgi:RimJ/RimL family protein N-acetyltransferase
MLNQEITIRKIVLSDAAAFEKLRAETDAETEFMAMNPGERKADLDKIERQITKFTETPRHLLLVADTGKEFVGFLLVHSEGLERYKHVVHIVTAVKKSHWRQGIASRFFNTFHIWAEENNIHRIDLEVIEDNIPAINLYKKFGYEVEGTRKDAIYNNKTYKNLVIMAKILS